MSVSSLSTAFLRLMLRFVAVSKPLSGPQVPQEFLSAHSCPAIPRPRPASALCPPLDQDSPELFNATRSVIFGHDLEGGDASIPVESESEIGLSRTMGGVRPLEYDVTVSLVEKPLRSTTRLLLVAKRPTRHLQLNIDPKYLTLDLASLRLQDYCTKRPVCLTRVRVEPRQHLLDLELQEELVEGSKYVLWMEAQQTDLQKPNFGVQYESTFNVSTNLNTVFMFRSARTAFPCMDQPSLKARFYLRLEHALDTQARANMPAIFQQSKAERRVSVFQPTPPMSPYLLAFTVFRGMELKKIPELPGDSNLILPAAPDMADETLREKLYNLTVDTFQELGRFFPSPYPLPKYDTLLAQPFAAAGLENFGLSTLAASKIVFDKKSGAELTTEALQTVVHELVHSWMGNLVTMRSWDGTPLQEGLTVYLTALTTDALGYGATKEALIEENDVWQMRAHWFDFFNLGDLWARAQLGNFEIDEEDGLPSWFTFINYGTTPAILHFVDDAYGSELVRRLSAWLIKNFAYGSFGPDDVYRGLKLLSGSGAAGNFLRSWLSHEGQTIFSVSAAGDSGRKVRIDQTESSFGNFTVPCSGTRHLRLRLKDRTVDVDAAPAFLDGELMGAVDALSYARTILPGRILYTPAIYHSAFDDWEAALERNDSSLGEARQRTRVVLEDLAWGFRTSALPPEEDIDGPDFGAWLRLAARLFGPSKEHLVGLLKWGTLLQVECNYFLVLEGTERRCSKPSHLWPNLKDTRFYRLLRKSAPPLKNLP